MTDTAPKAEGAGGEPPRDAVAKRLRDKKMAKLARPVPGATKKQL